MMSSINKDGQFGFPEGEEEQDGTITYYQLETGSEDMFPPLPVCLSPLGLSSSFSLSVVALLICNIQSTLNY